MPAHPPNRATVLRSLVYVSGGHERHSLDLYLPGAGGSRPAVVWIHGGAFSAGDSTINVPTFLLEEGYIVAAINYRLSLHARFPAPVEDSKAAVRWLRARAPEFGIAPDRIGAFGESAGGYLAAMLGATAGTRQFDVGEFLEQSSAVQAVVDCFGPTDFLQMDRHRLPGGPEHDDEDSPESRLMGWPIQQHPEAVRAANPIAYLTPGAPPFLIVHGDADPLVPYHQSALLADALRRVDVPVTLHTVAGGGHGRFQDPATPDMVKTFLATHLSPPAL